MLRPASHPNLCIPTAGRIKVGREACFLKVWRDMVWVRLCVKLLKDSSFQGLFVHEAIGGF